MSRSRSRRWPRIALRIVLGLAVLVGGCSALVLWEWSPLAPRFYRFAAARGAKAVPGVSVEIRKAGFLGFLDAFSVSGFEGSAGDYATLKFDTFVISYRLLPILKGRASLRSVTLRDVVVRIDTTKSFPGSGPKTQAPEPGGGKTAPPAVASSGGPAGPSRLDLPSLDASNVTISVSFVAATGAPPTEVVFHDLRMVAGPGAAGTALPMGFSIDGTAAVDGGSSAVVRCAGGFAMKPGGVDAADADIDLSVRGIRMKDLNGILAHVAPFVVETGTLDCHFDARCRDGRLAGLASIEATGLAITENKKTVRLQLFQLSLGTWQMLVRDRKGTVKVDVDLGGRLRHPDIPIGPVLAAQLGTAGRSVAAGLLSAVPIGFVQDIGKSWDQGADDRARYDDVLKIDRLEKKERHFERARHYEKIVKNYKTAVEEYEAQVREFPDETDLAVRSLAAMAEVKVGHLKDPRGAIASLRRLVDTRGAHPDADDAMVRMIDIAIEAKDYSNADKMCREFKEKFPQSGLSGQVAERRQRIAKYVW